MNMKKALIWSVYTVAFILPVLSLINCPHYNEWNWVWVCFVEADLLRKYAEMYYGWLLVSVFTLFIPIIIYIVIVRLIIKLIHKKF